MSKIFMLSFANIRKTKGHTVSLVLMFIIAASLLNLGLLVFLNFGSYFKNVTTELNTSDVYYMMPNSSYSPAVDQYIRNHKNVTEMEKENVLWTTVSIPYNNDTRQCTFVIRDADTSRTLSKWKFVGKHLAPDAMSVYIPYVMSIDGGYKLNDKLEAKFKDTTLTFTVKGFIEDTYFSSLDPGTLGIYMPHAAYEKVAQELGDKCSSALVFANLKKLNKDVETGIRGLIKADSTSAVGDMTDTLSSLDLDLVKESRVFMASGIAVMMIAFAAIIAVVCLLVVRFRISNSIEEDMTKIGSLKAMGYSSIQIILSIILQFSMIAAAGSIAGISLSYFAIPVLSDVFAQQSGLKWVQSFDGFISGIALCTILLVAAAVSLTASRHIRRIHPIEALRGGITTHSFRKNRVPLDKSKGSLPWVLALKSMLQNMKQSIMLGIIFAAVAFVGTFAVVMFYNTTVDTRTFAETPGIELSDAIVVFKADGDTMKIANQVRQLKGVEKAQFIDNTLTKIDDYDVSVYVMEDYSKKETNTVYEGRYPRHSNEIALAGHLADMMGKKVGDSITLKIGEKQADYVVTGLSQGSYMGGINASIRLDGVRRLSPDFRQQSMEIYLKKGVSVKGFLEELKSLYGDTIIGTEDKVQLIEQGMGVYTSVVSKVGVAILVITIFVVILVLYFVINSSVIRKKRELGIQKAIGFTTLQLMNQLSVGSLPPIVIGVLAGGLLGITQTNTLMSIFQKGMGIMKAHYIVTPSWIALFGAGIVVVSYMISMVITFRIRKISAYALVTE